jgi:hypothetical protein
MNFDRVIEDIKHEFKFLFERGFKIHSVKELPLGDWQIALAYENFAILVYCEQGDINLMFSTVDSNFSYRVGLNGIIYFLSNGQVLIGKFKRSLFHNRKKQFERLAGLLMEHIDNIAPYFGKDYERYKHDMMKAQQRALDAYLDKYLPT